MVQDLHVNPVEDSVLCGWVFERGLAQSGFPSAPGATPLVLAPPEPTHNPDAETSGLERGFENEKKRWTLPVSSEKENVCETLLTLGTTKMNR